MSNEKFNTIAEDEVLENVEYTEHVEDTATCDEPQVEEVKENKLSKLKNKALAFIGKHKFAIGVAAGAAAVLTADHVESKIRGHRKAIDAEFVEIDTIDEPTVDVEEVDYPQEEVEDAVEE